MKFTWGHGITVAIVLFMSFIIYIVVQTFGLNADLVQDDFYEEEIRTNDKKIMAQNYAALKSDIQFKKTESGIRMIFPEALSNASGQVQFYRRDDKRLDQFFDIDLDSNRIQTFQYADFLEGKYDIKIECEKDKIKFLHQTSILF